MAADPSQHAGPSSHAGPSQHADAPTRFNFDVALATWRQFLSRDRAILSDDLDELEVHLRDEYDAARAEGLAPRAAFDRARINTGNPGDLHASYRRVESEKRYSHRGIGQEIRHMAVLARSFVTSGSRSLARSPVASIINMVGLSIAIASVITVFLFLGVYWTLDSFHERGDRIYLVNSIVERNGAQELRGTVPAALGPALEQTVAGVRNAVRVRNASARMTAGNMSMPERIMFADPTFLDVFTFPLATGSHLALENPTSVILSSTVAQRFFADRDPTGQQIALTWESGRQEEFVVAGVAEPFPANAGFWFSVLIGWDAQQGASGSGLAGPAPESGSAGLAPTNDWGEHVDGLFLELSSTGDVADVTAAAASFLPRQQAAVAEAPIQDFVLDNLWDPMPGAHRVMERASEAPHPLASGVFILLAALMLVLSCFNYINISVGQALRRLREIGVRKVMGGTRRQLMAQFMVENVLLCGAALVAGMVLAATIMIPMYNTLFVLQIESTFFSRPAFWAFLVLLLAGIAVLSGAYPSLYVSSFQPVSVLAGRTRISGNAWLTRAFLTTQFTLATATVLVVLFVAAYGDYMRALTWSPDADQTLVVSLPGEEQYHLLNQMLASDARVDLVSSAMDHPGRSFSTREVDIHGERLSTAWFAVDRTYLEALGLAGIDLRVGEVVVNESFARLANWQQAGAARQQADASRQQADASWQGPVGEVIRHNDSLLVVSGVVADFHLNPLVVSHPAAFVLRSPGSVPSYLAARIEPGAGPALMADITATWADEWPWLEHDMATQDRIFDRFLEPYDNVTAGVGYLAALALLIAAMGLFGLASQNISRRLKEISIRKVLGASTLQTMLVANRSYVWMLAIASVVASTLLTIGIGAGYALAPEELSLMPVTPWPFVFGNILVMGVAACTIALHARKVTRMNPAHVLQSS